MAVLQGNFGALGKSYAYCVSIGQQTEEMKKKLNHTAISSMLFKQESKGWPQTY